jgi:hypothetical protein
MVGQIERVSSMMTRDQLSISRRNILTGLAGLAGASLLSAQASAYQIGAYYFPGWHVDPRNEMAHGKGWTEWELVRRAEPRFPGHQQPKRPLWGYQDESDPHVFETKISAAAEHGLTHLIFDWYWYEGRPFLHRALENGYWKASNSSQLKFCLMWANHDWLDLHPAKLAFVGKSPVIFPGAVTRGVFEAMTDYIVAKYFTHPSYWRIEGCPYFSIYELSRLIEGLGGVQETRAALDSFRQKTRAAGLPDLHLNAIVWGIRIPPAGQPVQNASQILGALGFSSATSYVWVHHVALPEFPVTAYEYAAARASAHWRKSAELYGVPYHPNVTMGWDSSPRTCQSDRFANAGYPFTPVLGGNTPDAFRSALGSVKRWLDGTPQQPKILNINAWNEWTEGSYLEPDTSHKMEYLEAIKQTFL